MAVALLAAGCGGGESDSTQSTNDPDAAEELSSAASAMQQATGYRFDATVGSASAQIELVGEFQAPDRLHEAITVGGLPSGEVIFIGTNAFVQDSAAGVWRNQVQDAAAASTDLRRSFNALTSAESVTHSGTTYLFEVPAGDTGPLAGSDATGVVEGSAVIEDGLITTLTYRATVDQRLIEVTVIYTDIGSAPPVDEPVTG